MFESYWLLKTLFLAPDYIPLNNLEVVSVLIKNFSKTVVCAVYCPPNCCSSYSNDLDIILFHTFGAFRIVMIIISLWGILMRQISTGPHCEIIHLTLLVCAILCLITISQVIQIPTHIWENILDIVLTNIPEAVFNVNEAPFLITLLLHFVHMCLSLPQVLNHLFIILKQIGLDYLSTFSITTLIYCFMMMILILFGSLSETFSCLPSYVCFCGSDSFCCQLHILV